MQIPHLIKVRQYLHQNPELSHHEKETARFLIDQIKSTKPNEIVQQTVGHGFLVRYECPPNGSAIAFRTDIDALPIDETNNFTYKSTNKGISHKCGHDGHATSMLGFAQLLMNEPLNCAELVFQAAEETGMGAEQWLSDKNMANFHPKMIFAYHNLPGFRLNSIVVRKGVFSAASVGVTIRLAGKTSHAAHPERGISPALALASLIQSIEQMPQNESFVDFVLTTVVHAHLGEIAFGTAPGHAELRATLRSFHNTDLKLMQQIVEKIVHNEAVKYGLQSDVEYCEYFPATENNLQCVEIVCRAAESLGLKVIEREEPFRWSEDFAHFTLRFPGALFGIGAGENHPQLHNPDYDFPDEILPVAAQMFHRIYQLSKLD